MNKGKNWLLPKAELVERIMKIIWTGTLFYVFFFAYGIFTNNWVMIIASFIPFLINAMLIITYEKRGREMMKHD